MVTTSNVESFSKMDDVICCCIYRDDMKKHLKSSHNIIKKSDLESKLQMAKRDKTTVG